MLLWANVKAGFKTHINFNQKAIRSIFLHDDILILNYKTKRGNEEDFSFNEIVDADLFLYNTLSGYRSGQFSAGLLGNFLESTSNRLKTYIPTESTGFGKLNYLTYGRFIVTEAVETLSLLNRGASFKQPKEKLNVFYKRDYIEFLKVACQVAIKQIKIDKNKNAVLVFKANKAQAETILTVSPKGELNSLKLKAFCECVPIIDFGSLTLKDAEVFGLVIYDYAKTSCESMIADISDSRERK